MANDVVLSAALRSNLLSLQNTQKGIDASQFKLSTGKKVNSALDNPQSFFAAQALTNRAADLTRLLDGIGQSIQVIKAADNGVTALTSLINSANSIATSAQDAIAGAAAAAVSVTGNKDLTGLTVPTTGGPIITGNTFNISTYDATGTLSGTAATITLSTGDTAANIAAKITAAFSSATAKVTASLDSTGHLNLSLTSGYSLRIDAASFGTGAPTSSANQQAGFSALGLSAYLGAEDIAGTTNQQYAATISSGTSISSKALVATAGGNATTSTLLSAITGFSTGGTTNHDDTFSVSAGGQTFTLDLNGTTVGDFVNQLNSSPLAGLITASFDSTTAKITLTATSSTVSKITLGTNSTAAPTVAAGFGFGIGRTGATASDTLSENIYLTNTSTSTQLTQYQTQYNAIRNQIDALVTNGDTAYRGTNLLNGNNLVSTFNESRTSTLTTAGVKFDSTGLGLSAANFTTAAGINTALTQTTAALTSVRNFGTQLAGDLSTIQTRQDFTNNIINTLTTGSDLLTNADQNEEGAKLLALQTRQSLGVTALSLASQSQQSVLRLFS